MSFIEGQKEVAKDGNGTDEPEASRTTSLRSLCHSKFSRFYKTSSEHLCQSCTDVDMPSAFEGKGLPLKGASSFNGCPIRVITRKSSEELSWRFKFTGTKCKMCCFMLRAIYPDSSHSSDKQADSSSWNTHDSAGFSVVQSHDTWQTDGSAQIFRFGTWEARNLGYPSGMREMGFGIAADNVFSKGTVRFAGSLVDFGILRDWIASCQTSHSLPQCRGSHLSQFTTPIRVIDCQTRKVILAPKDCKYIALSYVWGVAGSSHETVNGNDIPALPRTIRDSITVTTSMGYRYLWVDKYCIKQDENSDLLAQVQQMDLIYRQAQATIIACAGSSPDSGLPGVSTPRTIVQARVTVGHLPLVTFRLFPWVEPNSSKWQTRGWTFQEHLLSSRRLFFTDEQVLFACNEFWASEMFRHPQKLELSLRTYPGSSSIWKPKSGLSGVQPMAHWRGNGSLPTLLQYIEEYSKRELTKPNDIFNAFHGILKAFMAINPSISHLWGIPFSGEQVDSLNSFCHCLLWENRCMLRREGFPSWSWVGWLGAAAFDSEIERFHGEGISNPKTKASIELKDGSRMPWSDLGLGLNFDTTDVSRFIILTVPTFLISWRIDRGGGCFRLWYCKLGLKLRSVERAWRGRPALYDSGSTYLAVYMYYSTVLLLQEKEVCWERVGLLDLNEVPMDVQQLADSGELLLKEIRLG